MKKTAIYITSVMLILALTGCGSKDDLNLKKDVFQVELGQSVSTNAKTYLNKDTDKEVLKKAKVTFDKSKSYTQDKKVDVLKPTSGNYIPVGKYQAKISYKDESKKLTIQVKDTTPPKFTKCSDITLTVNSNTDLTTMFTADDLSPVTISINKDKLDTGKVGSYKIQVTAADKYKNKTTKQVTVNIVEQLPPTDSEETQAPADGTAQANGNATPSNGNTGGTVSKPSGGSNSQSGNTGNTGGGSSSGDVCTPVDLGNAGRLFATYEEANSYAYAIWNSHENDEKAFDDIPNNHIRSYGVGSAGCGYSYVVFDYD